ncbi:nucleotidyltransferase family protein [Congregibacter sp.]|uniref:nucleotidyltransferase family protein n=1 Tax=Congregibacter sp. TaxID=2744308 RepID=UPI003F6D8223
MNKDSQPDFPQGAVVLMLAAGRAKRFGDDKRQVILKTGKTLLEQSISQFTSLGLRVFLSLSTESRDDILARKLRDESVELLRCQRAGEGMGGTLAESVESIGDANSILIALADMPGLGVQTILLLQQQAHRERIVFPVYEGRRGHPVMFGQRFIPLLKNLSGDVGANHLINEYASECIPVPVIDPGVVRDVDVASDLPGIERLLQARSS